MGAFGLTAAGWTFAFNDRRRSLGYCRFPSRGRPGRVELSRHHVRKNPLGAVENTLRHEIAHALAGEPGHGPR
jgi:hypothetical protein